MPKKPRQKFKYLENKKSFEDQIKSILHHFWRAVIEADNNFFFGKWEADFKVITYSTPRTLEFKSCLVFPLWPESSIEVWLTDRPTGETDRPKEKHVGGSNTF